VTASASASEAQAQRLGDNGEPIRTSNYTLDLYEGPVLAGSRIVGLAGAYVPLAEGVAGFSFNPASAAKRAPWSSGWFDWEIDGGVTLPASLTGTDFDNNGDESFANEAAFFITGGIGLQFGDLGLGLGVDFQQYKVRALGGPEEGSTLNVNLVRGMLVTGYSFLDGQLIFGIALSSHHVSIERPVEYASRIVRFNQTKSTTAAAAAAPIAPSGAGGKA